MKHFLHAMTMTLEGLAGISIVVLLVYGCMQSGNDCHIG